MSRHGNLGSYHEHQWQRGGWNARVVNFKRIAIYNAGLPHQIIAEAAFNEDGIKPINRAAA
jgi:hypothetical protein